MKKDKKELILQAVEKIIQSKRFHEVKVEDVAKIAGVGKGTIYRYFASKEELFFQLAIFGFSTVQNELELLIDLDISFREKLQKVTDRFLNFIVRRKNIFRIMREMETRSDILQKNQKEELSNNKRAVQNIISRVMKEGLEKNLLVLDISPIQYSELWIHTFVGLSHWDKRVDSIDFNKIIDLHLRKEI